MELIEGSDDLVAEVNADTDEAGDTSNQTVADEETSEAQEYIPESF